MQLFILSITIFQVSHHGDFLESKPVSHCWLYCLGTCHVVNFSNSFEDRPPADFIYRCPIFKWVAVTWLNDRAPMTRVTCPIQHTKDSSAAHLNNGVFMSWTDTIEDSHLVDDTLELTSIHLVNLVPWQCMATRSIHTQTACCGQRQRCGEKYY